MEKVLHRLPCLVAGPFSIPFGRHQTRGNKSWFQKKEKKQEPRPVYDDELEDDEEEENVIGPVALAPPRVQHEEIELKTIASQPQPEAGPSPLTVTDHLEAQSS
ncbi:hypothetical protein DFJ58DRAFT_840209 [Suillus subalutaceus]|uniref:uncharacterized protein n=1 Tax=Suillus subalutaceus TaxID=48586 RepID=UPI001B87CAB9|nr:uncharacterized protein DFJ58DRAFT_840209 [Suillus subalutaceus]KAG1859343.1 hypothetical protein DFJ58DRAFT_840209 [Suillus subalutaceus]